jgi:hypothetical protein
MITRDITNATIAAVEPEMMEGMDPEMEMAPQMESPKTARENGGKRRAGRASPLRGGIRLNFSFPAAALIQSHNLKTAEEIVSHFATHCLSVPLPEATRTELLTHLNQDLLGDVSEFDANRWDASRRVKGMLHLFFSTPEYQMN